jgi:HSP20 family protein
MFLNNLLTKLGYNGVETNIGRERRAMANIIRQEDFRQDLARLEGEMDQLTRRVLRPASRRRSRVFPSIIISTTDEDLLVRAEVPGMKLDDFDINVSGDTLTVEGHRVTDAELEGGWYHRRERARGRFSRAIRLPTEVDGERAEATYVSGVLTITLPLQEPAKPKQIPVKVVEG